MTHVVFRKWKDDGSIIALFPYEDESGGRCMCYEHLGQHGGADYDAVIKKTWPASELEYIPLLKELRQIGYDDLKIIRKKGRR